MIGSSDLAGRPSYIAHLLGPKIASESQGNDEECLATGLYHEASEREERGLGGVLPPPEQGGTRGAKRAAH